MGKNIVEKILDAHLVSGIPHPGEEVGITIDQTLTQDATGTMAYLEFEAMGYERVHTERSVSYVDHNTVQDSFENADDHRYLHSVARKYGIHFSRPGNGICHQVHLERFGVPGKTLLGSDSHTPTGGGLGMLAIGAGGLDVALAMGGKPFYLTYPRVVQVRLSGTLPAWVSAKDVILKVLQILSTKGNVGTILEFGGEGVATLSVPERATITNMGAETGVTTSVFPSDEQTRAFLTAQQREEVYVPLVADEDAAYADRIDIDLSALQPLCACPHSPGNIDTVENLQGTPVDQVLIGSCTNASYRDLMMVAHMLKGRRVHENVSLGVAAGSRQVLHMISRNGALTDIVDAGARLLESVCGFCIGNSLAPATNAVSLRTSNRNFLGRSGTRDAQVYLVSPETAAASATAGCLVDPSRTCADTPHPHIPMPARFEVDDSMIVPPEQDVQKACALAVHRGPNIGDPPHNEPLPPAIDGVVTIKVGDKITTDHIMPAGRRLKYRSNIARYAIFVFEGLDPAFAERARENAHKGLHNIIVAGESYGQGSSREHAAICPMYLGVRMVIARSIERIHKANLVNFGIVPACFIDERDYEALAPGDRLAVEDIHTCLEQGTRCRVHNRTQQTTFYVDIALSARERASVRAGGIINAVRAGEM
jgi:aconitate hydratase